MRTLTSTTVRRLTILARIQKMRLKYASRQLAMQAVLVALAVLLGVGGIGMLMLCLYTVMAEAFGLVTGALSTGALLLLMALAAIALAGRVKAPAEARLLNQLEENVMAEMSADIAELESGVRHIERGATALFKGDYLSAFANLASGLK